MVKIKEILCKSILNKSGILDYCINPYAGCQHNCIYCYARFMAKYVGEKMKNWGKFVYPKINTPVVLERQIKKASGSIYISSVTDAYQPLEKRYELTRKILQILLKEKEKFSISIQTKSDLVLRDIDLLKKLNCEVGFTITSLEKANLVEPFSSLPLKRIEALKELNQSGIKTYVFIGPILPHISEPLEIIKKTQSFVDYYYIDKLNLRPGVWQNIRPFLKKYRLLEKYEKIFFGESDYYSDIKEKIKKLVKENNLNCNFCY